MRKKLALLLAAIMVIGMIPMTAFATTTNRISNVVTGQEDDILGEDTAVGNVPELRIYEKDLTEKTTKQAFELDLTNAEWDDLDGIVAAIKGQVKGNVNYTQLSAKSAIFEVEGFKTSSFEGNKIGFSIPMLVKLTDNGDATVTIDPMESVISAGTYKFATVADGSATVTVEKKKDVSESGDTLKNIVIKETSAGAIESGKLKLKLTSDWSFKTEPTVNVYPSEYQKYFKDITIDDEDCEIDIPETFKGSTTAMTITILAQVKYDDNEVDPGDICEMTVSGAGVDKTTLEVATAVTYGVSWTAEDKELPIFYSGSMDEDQDSLEVTMEEDVAASWLTDRKTKIVFPEGVRILGVDISDQDNIKTTGDFTINDDANELTFNGWEINKSDDTAEVHFKFQFSIKPDFTGDITATLTGKGVDEDITVVVGKAVAPITVEADKTDVVIDYRHTAVGDIIITEAEAGILEKGTHLGLRIDKLSFDDDPTVEVISGDLKIKDVDVTNSTTGGNSFIDITIDSASAKEPAVIKLTNVECVMDRSVPAGSYALKTASVGGKINDELFKGSDDKNSKIGEYKWDGTSFNCNGEDLTDDAIFRNTLGSGSEDYTPLFDKGNVTVYSDYINVVTAGRDVDDSTFTTTLKVTIGATEMYANDKAIALDVPAYIANGYTMLPVRAVTEALSGTAIVRWDDATKTVTITFGARVINMVVGSDTMVINGVDVPMQAKCEITDSRAFIPLRDMGYALGLNDSKIQWDDATKTATLN